MEKLIEILTEIDNSIDYRNEKALIDDRIIDSMIVVALVGEIEAEFDIKIEAADMVPDNFNSVDAMMKMIERIKEEQ